MAIKKILTAPDPFLKQISKPVEKVTKDIQQLMDDMLETMYDAPGIGLAAVQIGVPLRVISMGLQFVCLLYTSPSPRDLAVSRMPSSA